MLAILNYLVDDVSVPYQSSKQENYNYLKAIKLCGYASSGDCTKPSNN